MIEFCVHKIDSEKYLFHPKRLLTSITDLRLKSVIMLYLVHLNRVFLRKILKKSKYLGFSNLILSLENLEFSKLFIIYDHFRIIPTEC